MDSCKFTEFGLCVKTELLRRGLEQKWLIEKIQERGMYADSSYLHKIFTGQRAAPRIVQAIREILDLPADDPIIPQTQSN